MTLVSGCAKKPEFGRESLPAMVDGGWQIAADSPVDASEWPESVKALHPKQAMRVDYRGPQNYRATVYEFPAPESAFELVQKWRAQPGTTAFQHKALFVVVEGQPLISPAFVKSLDQSLP